MSRWTDLPLEYVIPHYKLIDQDLIAHAMAAGKKNIVWTVNARTDIKRFIQWEVDGIISDYPERLALTRAGTEQQQK